MIYVDFVKFINFIAEPEFRTEFEVTIRHPSTYNAVSNAPVYMIEDK
jgi:aminopeptidase N